MAFLLRKRDFLILLLAVFAYYYIVEDEGHTLASSMNSTAKHMVMMERIQPKTKTEQILRIIEN